ncbi:MAG: hypothetical protein GX146_00290 [Myxococcales bacterium]|nr:hypothetical protein [Myxococcales bacterium]
MMSRCCRPRMGPAVLVKLLGILLTLAVTGVHAQHRHHIPMRFLLHGALLSDMPGLSNAAAGFGGALEVGLRVRDLEGFLHFEQDSWLAIDNALALRPGVVNIGLGLARYFFRQRLCAKAVVGTSTLLFATPFHPAGTTGLFVALEPAVFRLPFRSGVALVAAPLSLAWLVPARESPTLRRLEYRLSFGIEVPL